MHDSIWSSSRRSCWTNLSHSFISARFYPRRRDETRSARPLYPCHNRRPIRLFSVTDTPSLTIPSLLSAMIDLQEIRGAELALNFQQIAFVWKCHTRAASARSRSGPWGPRRQSVVPGVSSGTYMTRATEADEGEPSECILIYTILR